MKRLSENEKKLLEYYCDIKNKMEYENSFLEKLFEENKEKFEYFGGDIENLIQEIRYKIAQKMIYENRKEKVITSDDITEGYEKFSKRKTKNRTNDMTMYI